MAFNSMLRRASKSLFPLTIRSVGCPRPFHRAIPTVLSVERRRLGHEISRQSFLPFSTLTAEQPSSDEKLSRVLVSEIQCVEEPENVDGIPEDFPFEIQDNAGERTIYLVREYNNERITVQVDMPIMESEDDDDDANDDQKTESTGSSIPLTVSIFKGDSHRIEFAISAFRNEIKIDSMTIKDRDADDDFPYYEGPDFDDLDENLQQAFIKYLAVRGIEPSITSSLMEYMLNKENKEYLLWLKGFKHFVDK